MDVDVWVRRAAFVVALLGLVLPALVVRDLVTDHDCLHAPRHHVGAVAIVVLQAIAAAWAGVTAQRGVERLLSERVHARSVVVSALVASATLAPGVALGIATGFLAAWIDSAATFSFCIG